MNEQICAAPLTRNQFAAYGQVIQSFCEPIPQSSHSTSITNSIKITPANQGTACKFNHIAQVTNLRTSGPIARAEPNLSLFHCKPAAKLPIRVNLLERHQYSSQAFIPMGNQQMRGYLVIVCLNGDDDKPNLSTLRAFIASRTQGINYDAGVWHHPIIALEETTDFVCLTHESGVSGEDCEEITITANVTVEVPDFHGSEE